jgi:hypothetical protein
MVAVGALSLGYVAGQINSSAGAFAASKHATAKASGTPGTPRPVTPHADGTVVSVSGNTITVTPDADTNETGEYTGVTTIVVNSSTTYRGVSGVSAITAGTFIIAEGTVSSDGKTLTATSVGVGGPGSHGGHGGGHGGHGAGGPHADGTIVSISGNTVTVKPDADTNETDEYTKVTNVLLTSSTTYGHGQTKAAIVAGANFMAGGTLSADGTTLTATTFEVHTAGPKPVATAAVKAKKK